VIPGSFIVTLLAGTPSWRALRRDTPR